MGQGVQRSQEDKHPLPIEAVVKVKTVPLPSGEG